MRVVWRASPEHCVKHATTFLHPFCFALEGHHHDHAPQFSVAEVWLVSCWPACPSSGAVSQHPSCSCQRWQWITSNFWLLTRVRSCTVCLHYSLYFRITSRKYRTHVMTFLERWEVDGSSLLLRFLVQSFLQPDVQSFAQCFFFVSGKIVCKCLKLVWVKMSNIHAECAFCFKCTFFFNKVFLHSIHLCPHELGV